MMSLGLWGDKPKRGVSRCGTGARGEPMEKGTYLEVLPTLGSLCADLGGNSVHGLGRSACVSSGR